MVSMKTTPKKKGKGASATLAGYEEPAYPYGLSISLNDECLTKLGIKDLPKVGTKVRIVAMAEVQSVSQHQEQDGDQQRSVSLQITDMEPPKGAAKGDMYDRSEMSP